MVSSLLEYEPNKRLSSEGLMGRVSALEKNIHLDKKGKAETKGANKEESKVESKVHLSQQI